MNAIGTRLGRHRSTICRELRRNGKPTKAWPGGYDAERAENLARRRRRWDGRFKLARQPALQALVRDGLAMGWSPEQIAGRLAQDKAGMTISHESIYRFIYHLSAQRQYWHRLLPRRKSRRGRLGLRGGSPVDHIRDRVSIDRRPACAVRRKQPGHWEADLMLFRVYGQAVLVAHERTSRLLLVHRQPGKQALPVAHRLQRLFTALPSPLRRTVTFDNGTEFARHHLLHPLGLRTFFCDPHKPWQKGGIENAIGRLRRVLPRKSDLAAIPQSRLAQLAAAYNNTPRKCLGFRTPAEVFLSHLLHFKRESTCRHAPAWRREGGRRCQSPPNNRFPVRSAPEGSGAAGSRIQTSSSFHTTGPCRSRSKRCQPLG